MSIDLSVVIVSINHRKFLRALLDSIFSSRHNASIEVIVVDNGSTDGSRQMLSSDYPDVKTVYSEGISGYAKNCNVGICRSHGKYILILNPDVVVLEDTLSLLVAFTDDNPNVGITGPQLLYPDGSLQFSCRELSTPWVTFLRGLPADSRLSNICAVRRYMMSNWTHDEPRSVGWVMGASMMVRRRAIEAVGLMDESYFLYFEDQDWCYRMWKKDWQVWYFPYARMIHYHQRDSAKRLLSRKSRIHISSMFRFFAKYGLETWEFNRQLRRRWNVLEPGVSWLGTRDQRIVSQGADGIQVRESVTSKQKC